MTVSLNMNQRALDIVERMVTDPDGYGIRVAHLDNGTRWLDLGLATPGSLEAGRLLAEVSLGGLGTVDFTPLSIGGRTVPGVTVRTDHPAWACLAAQAGGRTLRQPDYDVILSGPARGLAAAQDAISVALGYAEHSPAAVLCVEGRTPPPPAVAGRIADAVGVTPAALTLLVAPTASVVGSVQIAARIVEVPMLKLHNLGMDTRQVLCGWGACPLPPVAADDLHAMGCANDAILYGGQAHFVVRADEAELEGYLPRVPASAAAGYGAPFYDLMRAVDFEFYQLDPMIFGPAMVTFNNVATGRTLRAGQLEPAVLWRSFGDPLV
jgi:methenyltetrahydromethanopterin cyclohydrolase